MITVFANLKGGSGKSTVAFNLGIWLANNGVQVAAYDLDPQASLSDAVRVREEEGYAPPLPTYPYSHPLADQLQEHSGEVLVDVGASNMTAMGEAVGVADRVVIPVPPGQADVWGTQRFLVYMRDWVDASAHPRVLAFVNRADTHRLVQESNETEQALGQLPQLEVLPTRLSHRTVFRRSFSEGMGVNEAQRNSKAAKEFRDFARTLYPELS